MPIRVSELEEAKKPLADRICDWLSQRQGEAFKVEEIIAAMNGIDASMISLLLSLASLDPTSDASKKAIEPYEPYMKALGRLKLAGRIESGEVRGSTYYYVAEKKQ